MMTKGVAQEWVTMINNHKNTYKQPTKPAIRNTPSNIIQPANNNTSGIRNAQLKNTNPQPTGEIKKQK